MIFKCLCDTVAVHRYCLIKSRELCFPKLKFTAAPLGGSSTFQLFTVQFKRPECMSGTGPCYKGPQERSFKVKPRFSSTP